jgi:D-alanyl-D-alanine carboxypeptidase (penicillin-binding protein 5/6)
LNDTRYPVFSLFTSFIIFLFALVLAQAQAAPSIIPNAPEVNAKAYLLMDYDSGYIITSQNADERMEPASLTKMMSSYVISTELDKGTLSLGDKVKVSEKAWRMPGSRMFIKVGTEVTVGELLKGMIIQSGNDATVALAQHMAGSEDAFTSLMNQHAERLGMTGTHFANSTGLPDPDHYTTAHDLAILARALIRDFPDHYEWYSEREYKYNNIKQKNRNDLLWRDESVDGIKTGHTKSAGYCLVASAKRKNMRLISVVLGTHSEKARANESQKLLTYGFRFFETHRLYTANEPLTRVRVWKGDTEQLPLGLNDDLYVTIPRGQYKHLDANMSINAEITAPVHSGQILGTVNVRLGDQSFAERKLISMQAVEPGSFWHSLVDAIKLKFQ